MGALVQTLPHHHRLRPAKEGSAPSSPCPWLPDRPAFRRILSLRFRSGPQSCSPLDQAHPLRGGRDFYTRACPTAGHPTAKSGITTQLSGPVLRRNLHPLGECSYGLQLLLRGLSLFPVFLPVLLLWIRLQVGYDARAFVAQTVFGEVLLVLTYAFTDPSRNINWVFGPGSQPQRRVPSAIYLAAVMVFFPMCVYWPTHQWLRRILLAPR
jgi:hypothetical protein